MTKQFLKVSWIFGLTAGLIGCGYAYDNGVEWEDSSNSSHNPTDTTPADSADDSADDSNDDVDSATNAENSTDDTSLLPDTESSPSSDDSETEETFCDDGWRAEGGVCVFALAEEQILPGNLADDDSYIYWTTSNSADALGNPKGDAAIKRVKKSGGDVEIVATNGNRQVYMLRLDESYVYWVNSPDYVTNLDYELLRAPKEGGEPELLTVQSPEIYGMEVGDQAVFFAVNSSSYPELDSNPTYIMSMPKDGGAEPTIFYEESRALYAMTISQDRSMLYWVGLMPQAGTTSSGTLTHAPIDQSSAPIVRELSWGESMPMPTSKMIADNDDIYFTQFMTAGSNAQLRKYSLGRDDRTGLTVAIRPNEQMDYQPFLFAFYDDQIYWSQSYQRDADANIADFVIARSPKEPGDAVTFIDNQRWVSGIAVDNDYVYWLRQSDAYVSGAVSPTGELVKMKRTDIPEVNDTETEAETETETETEVIDTESETEDSDTNDSDDECTDGFHLEGGACILTIADEQKSPRSLASDADNIYWTTLGSRDALNNYLEDGAVQSASKADGTIKVLAEGLHQPDGIRVDDTHVYWKSSDYTATYTDDAVLRVDKDGENTETLIENSNLIADIAVGNDKLYYAVRKTPTEEEHSYLIMEMPKDGSAEATVFYEESEVIQAMTMSPDRQTLYWYAVGLMKSPVDKSTEPSLVGDLGGWTGEIFVDEEAAYCVIEGAVGDTELRKLLLADEEGDAATLAQAEFTGGSVAPYGDNVYWTQYGTGMLMRSPKIPGESVVLVENQNHPVDIAVDEDAVYWINGGSDMVNSNGGVFKMKRE